MSEGKWIVFASVLFSVLGAAALFPFLFLGEIFSNTDAVTYYYPAFHFYSEALHGGESFLWNPYLFSGFPMYLSQSAGFLDPLNIFLFRIFDAFDAYHVRLFIGFFLTMLFSCLAARSLGLSRHASLVVGPAYLVAFNWWYISNPVIVNSLFLLPFLLWVGMSMAGGVHRWRFTVLAGLGIGWSLLAGYAQLTIYTMSAWGVFILAEVWWVSRRSPRERISTILLLGGAAIIGALVALPQLLPALDFTPLTGRAEGLAYGLSTFKVINPGDLILFIFPDYLYFPYLSGGRRPLYVGVLLFILAVMAAVSLIRSIRAAHMDKMERRMSVVVGLLAFCFVAALAYSPVYYVLQHLPVFSYFRFPYRWMYVGAWFLALLGAWGIDRLRDAVPGRWMNIIAATFTGVAALFTAAATLLTFAGQTFWNAVGEWIFILLRVTMIGSSGLTKDPEHYHDAIVRGINAWQEALSLTEISFVVPFALLVGAVALVWQYVGGKISRELFSRTAVGLSLATFILVFAVQWSTSLPRTIAGSHAELLSFIPLEERALYRTFPFMLGESLERYIPPQYSLDEGELRAVTMMQFYSGWSNTNTFAKIASADGYDPFVPVRMRALLEEAGSTHSGEDVTRSLSNDEKIARLYSKLPLLGEMSVKYILSGMPLSHRNLTLVRTEPIPPYGAELYIYENTHALPRVRFISPGAASDTLTLIEVKSGSFTIETRTVRSRALLVAESNLPGWEATIDGAPSAIPKGLFIELEVPAGKHTLVLTYVGMRGELHALRMLGIVQ